MKPLSTALLGVACGLLPTSDRARYQAEWEAEFVAVRLVEGSRASAWFLMSLIGSAVSMTVTLRLPPHIRCRDFFLGVGALGLPTVFFLGHGVAIGEPIVIITQAVLLLGVVLVGVGAVRNDWGRFESPISRLGIGLSVVSACAITAVNVLADFDNPIREAPYRVLAGSVLVVAGLGVLLLSGLTVRFRSTAVRGGLSLLFTGCIVWAAVALINTLLVHDWIDRMYQFVPAPSLIALAYATWLAMDRRPSLNAQMSSP
ncbi:MAG: hypothetical protein ACN4GZ_00565 [Acidimicrobiales bacterium]